ncbi:GNAT family N-acetyltransferase [Xanthomonas vasicola]|uniref:GNAT family N-acetyltransferase n=1 Tax=Xanthomonas vasicola TaxID=56459 RepID=UPI000A3FB4CE|nr:GNAT family N-acetyltransferase [Xanthomonas vasicola]
MAYDAQELAWLSVAPDAQRRGVGAALVAAVPQDRPNVLSLELLQGNDTALAFYQRCGFGITGRHGRMPGHERFAVRVQAMQCMARMLPQRRINQPCDQKGLTT